MNEEKFKPSAEYLEMERMAKAIRKDIETAKNIIREGIAKYKKIKLNARSKKQAEDLNVFDELKDYSSMKDIQDAYGYECISESQYDRLRGLWEARENYIDEQGKFKDRVTELLERALYNCGETFFDQLEEFDAMERKCGEDMVRILSENSANDYKRYIAGIRNETNLK